MWLRFDKGFAISTFHVFLFEINFWDKDPEPGSTGVFFSLLLSAHVSPVQAFIQNPPKQFSVTIQHGHIPERSPPRFYSLRDTIAALTPTHPAASAYLLYLLSLEEEAVPSIAGRSVNWFDFFSFFFRATCEHLLKHKTGICFDPAITYGQKEPCAKMFPEASFIIEKEKKKRKQKQLLINGGRRGGLLKQIMGHTH